MKTSDTIVKLAPALVRAQAAIRFAVKDATNPAFKNKYADLGAVIEAVKPALNDNGIAFIQLPSPSEDGKLHLTTRLMHESGEYIEDTAVLPLSKNDAQGYGSAMTYARRYCLAAITGLYQDDDDGNAATGAKPAGAAAQASKPSQPAQASRPASTPTSAVSADRAKELVTKGGAIAPLGMKAYEQFFVALTSAEKKVLLDGGHHAKFKEAASKVAA